MWFDFLLAGIKAELVRRFGNARLHDSEKQILRDAGKTDAEIAVVEESLDLIAVPFVKRVLKIK